jgi:hypothetical protein
VIVWAQPRLLPLLRTLEPGIRLLPLHDGTPEVDFDVDIEIMELPYAWRTTLDTIPANIPYLHVAAAPLPPAHSPRVGLVWRAGDWDPGRSLDFAQLAHLLDRGSIAWYSFQQDARDAERHAHLRRLELSTVIETAAHIRSMDLVISVDSMPAHLTGALGVPVWTLLQHRADWRWMDQRADSPWYPTMRLFRQSRTGDWEGVIAAVQRALILLDHHPVPVRAPAAMRSELPDGRS